MRVLITTLCCDTSMLCWEMRPFILSIPFSLSLQRIKHQNSSWCASNITEWRTPYCHVGKDSTPSYKADPFECGKALGRHFSGRGKQCNFKVGRVDRMSNDSWNRIGISACEWEKTKNLSRGLRADTYIALSGGVIWFRDADELFWGI